jgi:hypothetical protein
LFDIKRDTNSTCSPMMDYSLGGCIIAPGILISVKQVYCRELDYAQFLWRQTRIHIDCKTFYGHA